MKAIIHTKYGPPEQLQLQEITTPTPAANQVLVKVCATSINSADLDYLRGTFLTRLGGPRKPMYQILGSDIAGKVEAVGQDVRQFRPGDEVFGDLSEGGFGAFAEYVCVTEDKLVLKPHNLTFEEAAAVPTAGIIALQGLQQKQIEPGQKLLINGAGGGVGTFGVQLAKLAGAEITGVDSSLKLDTLKALGADHVIDYKQQDYTKNGKQYDLVLDVVARRSVFDYRRTLTANGLYLMVGGTVGAILQIALMGGLLSRLGSKKLALLIVKPTSKDLTQLKDLLEAGKIAPVIDKCYPLSEISAALHYFETGQAKGKVVITMPQN